MIWPSSPSFSSISDPFPVAQVTINTHIHINDSSLTRVVIIDSTSYDYKHHKMYNLNILPIREKYTFCCQVKHTLLYGLVNLLFYLTTFPIITL